MATRCLQYRSLLQVSEADLKLQEQLQEAQSAEAELSRQLVQKSAEITSLQYGRLHCCVWEVGGGSCSLP